MKLPRKLKSEPLVEAVFEVRFKSNAPASSIFPGLLYRELPGEKSFQKQPASDFPEAFRNSDMNLQYAPLVGLVWSNYAILVGDRSFGIACRLPYQGWTNFKGEILRIEKILSTADLFTDIERCSLKYTNIIPANLGKTADVIVLNVSVGGHAVENGPLQFRSEIAQDGLIHIVQVA